MSDAGHAAGVRRIAHVDLSALRSNLRFLLAQDSDLVLDARANAYGHGLNPVLGAALEAGIKTVLVSADLAHVSSIAVDALSSIDSRRNVVGPAAYGLDGLTSPVMTLTGEVIAVKRAETGSGVSYGYSYRTTQATTLALVALGYADGVPRLASNRARVHLAGALRPLVGRVAMDQFVVDCGGGAPSVGDDVVLFGNPSHGFPSTIEWAKHTQRSASELTAGLGSRIERRYT